MECTSYWNGIERGEAKVTEQCPIHGEVIPIDNQCPWGCRHKFGNREEFLRVEADNKEIVASWIGVNEMAEILGCSRSTVGRMAKRKIIPHVIALGKIKFMPEHVEQIKQAAKED